jgi:hypothetical protein
MSIVGVTASSRRQEPNAPTIGTATDVGTSRAFNNGAAVVTFTPSLIGFEATSYTVTSSPGGFTASGASSPLTVTGLQSNTAYTFTATATNFVGTGPASAASNSITATTVPQAPTIGTPTLADGQAYTGSANIGVVFTAGATGGKTITTFTATSSSTTAVSGADSPITMPETVGTARTYTVTASNANGTSLASSASASITPSSVPQAPTVNSVTSVSGRPVNSPQASVAFAANATGGSTITGFTVTSSSGATNTGATSPVLITETGSGTYTYTVTATNARGTSLASVGVSGFISSVTDAPTIGTLSNVTGIAFGSNPQFTLTFTAPTNTGGSGITSYKYSTDGGTTYVTAPGTTSPLTLTTQSTSGTPGFVPGTNYTVTLIAVNANGDSPASAASNSQVAATIPSTPTFTLSSTGATNITGTYSYSTGGQAVTSYSSVISGISPTIAGTSPVGNTSGALTYTFSYVQGTQYTVPFSVTNPIGTATATSQTITPFAAAVPGAPATLSAAVASTTSVTLTYGAIVVNGSALTAWQGSGTSTGDIVSSPAVNLTYSGTPSAAGSTVTVTGAFAATQSYTFTLKARNVAGLGEGRTSNGVVPLPTITDNFNRTGSALGTTSSGSPWNTPAGSWTTNGSLALAGSDNSLGSVSFGTTVATVTADAGAGSMVGYGVAYWISSGSSYYQSYYQTYTYSYTYNSGPAYCDSCITYSCSQVSSTSSYAATPTTTYGAYQYYDSASSYPSTVTSRACRSSDVTNPSSPCTSVGQCLAEATGVVCSVSCPQGGVTSTSTSGTCYLCSTGVNGPNPSTGSGSIASCYTQSQTTTYSCPSGGTLSGTTCTVTTFTSGGTYPNCSGGVSASYSASPNTPAQGCGGCTTNGGGGGYIQPTATATATGHRVLTGVNGGATHASGDLGQAVSKITVVTSSGSSVVVTGFNSAGTQIYNSGAITPAASPTKVGNYGIFRGNSLNYNGVDNFSVS